MRLITGAIIGLGAAGIYYTKFYSPSHAGLPGILGCTNLKLKESNQITKDAKKYVFELNDPEVSSGITVGSFVVARVKTPEGTVLRPYTPISDVDQKGEIEFAIKTYEKGKLSKFLSTLQPGDEVSFKGPISSFLWKPNEFKQVYLIGGGAGITPLYQLLKAIVKNPNDSTKVDLIYSSSSDDIMLRDEIDDLVKSSDKAQVHYFVSEAKKDWKGLRGRIDKQFLQENLPSPSDDVMIFVCGPPGFYETICGGKPNPILQGRIGGILSELGYTKKNVHKF